MPVLLFEIDDEIEDEIFCFGLHVADFQQAKRMLGLMSEAVFIGELEEPELGFHEVSKMKLH